MASETQQPHAKAADQPIVTARGVIAGLMAGVVVGWALRGSMPPTKAPTPPMLPANIGVDRYSVMGKGPFAVYKPASKPLKKKAAVKPVPANAATAKKTIPIPGRRPFGSSSYSSPSHDGLQPLEPGGAGLALAPPAQGGSDLHAMESRARVMVMDGGGRVVSVSEAHGDGGQAAKTLVVTVPQSHADRLVGHLRSKLGPGVMVSDPETDGAESSADSDPVAGALAKGAQKEVDRLKEQLRQAATQFYPDAPAYKSLQEQYAEALQRLQDARKSLPSKARFHVVITGS